MAIEFEFYETPDPSGKKETTYHARAVTRNTVSTNKIIEEIAMASTLTPGDVKAALSLLSDMIAQHLENSERVHQVYFLVFAKVKSVNTALLIIAPNQLNRE